MSRTGRQTTATLYLSAGHPVSTAPTGCRAAQSHPPAPGGPAGSPRPAVSIEARRACNAANNQSRTQHDQTSPRADQPASGAEHTDSGQLPDDRHRLAPTSPSGRRPIIDAGRRFCWPGLVSSGARLRAAVLRARDFRALVTGHGAPGWSVLDEKNIASHTCSHADRFRRRSGKPRA